MASYTHTSDQGGKKRYYTCFCGWGASGSKRDVDFKVKIHTRRCEQFLTVTPDDIALHTAIVNMDGVKHFTGNGGGNNINITTSTDGVVDGKMTGVSPFAVIHSLIDEICDIQHIN